MPTLITDGPWPLPWGTPPSSPPLGYSGYYQLQLDNFEEAQTLYWRVQTYRIVGELNFYVDEVLYLTHNYDFEVGSTASDESEMPCGPGWVATSFGVGDSRFYWWIAIDSEGPLPPLVESAPDFWYPFLLFADELNFDATFSTVPNFDTQSMSAATVTYGAHAIPIFMDPYFSQITGNIDILPAGYWSYGGTSDTVTGDILEPENTLIETYFLCPCE